MSAVRLDAISVAVQIAGRVCQAQDHVACGEAEGAPRCQRELNEVLATPPPYGKPRRADCGDRPETISLMWRTSRAPTARHRAPTRPSPTHPRLSHCSRGTEVGRGRSCSAASSTAPDGDSSSGILLGSLEPQCIHFGTDAHRRREGCYLMSSVAV